MSAGIGLYGGSFDPLHIGHLIIARAVAERLDLQRVVFLPSATPPHKTLHTLADPAHRAKMVESAIAGEPIFEFSDYDLKRAGPSYTIDTVNHFGKLFGSEVELYWIIGADSLVEFAQWHRASELVDTCQVITAVRAGWEQTEWDKLRSTFSEALVTKLQTGVLETPVIEISSTDIRERIRQGASIRHLVPDSVRAYINEHGLYQ